MTIALIDYGSGNLHSALKALELEAQPIGLEVLLTSNIGDIRQASHIVLPGVGSFADCYRGLASLDGMIEGLEQAVHQNKTPFLGICVGMQLLADKGFENGEHVGLGWIKGSVRKINPSDKTLCIPHMGWNTLDIKQSQHPLFNGINPGDHAYFVHSYRFECDDEANVLATTNYGAPITAAIAKDNIMGVQFHPEKSQFVGLRMLRNFLEIK